MRKRFALLLTLALCVVLFSACTSTGLKAIVGVDKEVIKEVQRLPDLTDEQKETVIKLSPEYRRWILTKMTYLIITNTELEILAGITEPHQFEAFKTSFWNMRSYDDNGRRIDFRGEWHRRLLYVQGKYGVLDVRANAHMKNGPPSVKVLINCQPEEGTTPLKCLGVVPIEVWYYEYLPALKRRGSVIFYCKSSRCTREGSGWRFWNPQEGYGVFMDDPLRAEAGDPKGFERSGRFPSIYGSGFYDYIRRECFSLTDFLDKWIPYTIATVGTQGEYIPEITKPPTVETEGMRKIIEHRTHVSADAEVLTIANISGPTFSSSNRHPGKVYVDVHFAIPVEKLTAGGIEGYESYYLNTFIRVLLPSGSMYDDATKNKSGVMAPVFEFFEEDVSGGMVYPSMRVELYPGEYELQVRIADGNRAEDEPPLEAAWKQKIVVPTADSLRGEER